MSRPAGLTIAVAVAKHSSTNTAGSCQGWFAITPRQTAAPEQVMGLAPAVEVDRSAPLAGEQPVFQPVPEVSLESQPRDVPLGDLA